MDMDRGGALKIQIASRTRQAGLSDGGRGRGGGGGEGARDGEEGRGGGSEWGKLEQTR